MTRRVFWSEIAWSEFAHFQRNDPRVAKRTVTLIDACLRTPESGIGKPEKLKHSLSGYWSRRVTEEHRFVYSFTDDELYVVQVRYHYE